MAKVLNITFEGGDVEKSAPDLEVIHRQPKGRSIVSFPKWFDKTSGSIIYINCSFLTFVSKDDDVYYLVWPYSADAEVRAHWDEYKNEVVLDAWRNLKHIALYCYDRETLLKSWTTSTAVNVKPKLRIWNDTCPGDNTILTCWSIPRLPLLDTTQPHAPKSTELFDVCVDIDALRLLS